MSARVAPWTVLGAPAPGQHIAHLDSEPGFLERGLAQYVGQGLRQGDAVVVIAAPARWRAAARRLDGERLDLDRLARTGQLHVRDGVSCLAQVLADGMPDPARFHAVIGGLVEEAGSAGHRNVRAFGDMVDCLCRTNLVATMRLEELWAELLATRRLALLCGYSFGIFDPHAYRGLFQQVCATYSDLIAVEDAPRLERAAERAYQDVFGVAGNADHLRQALLAGYTGPAAVPEGWAAILAAQEFVPMTTGPLLERAHHHYRA
jgi:hypothetical protein